MVGVADHGEVWTDGGGFATVHLPTGAGALEPPLEYELRDIEPPSRACRALCSGSLTRQRTAAARASRSPGRVSLRLTRAEKQITAAGDWVDGLRLDEILGQIAAKLQQ